MGNKKLSYYNYFLLLSMVLIAGYFITSLFFMKKTSYSEEQAELYSKITELTDNVLKSTYKMEATAHGFLLTDCYETYEKYNATAIELNSSYDKLQAHCVKEEIALDIIDSLNVLIQDKHENISQLLKHNSNVFDDNEEILRIIQVGRNISENISVKLNDIRSVSANKRELSKEEGAISAQNTIFMLSLFGIVMLAIVVISFDKMKREIQLNESKANEIKKINIELESLNENLENFAYIASHDLNEPLRKIRTFGDLIQQEFEHDSPDKELIISHIERMQNSAERMQELIQDLLSYSRVSSGQQILEVTDLNSILKDVVTDLQMTISEKDAIIEVKDLPNAIKTKEVQMRQLFQNLIANALKFSKKENNPKIIISSSIVYGEPLNSLNFKEENEGQKFVKITITDNGIGFDEKYLDKIFGVFQRLHGRSAYPGTGIGLSICKKIVELHQGVITAKSKEEEGSTFIIYLPYE